jgi:hypothetical protein
MKERLLELVAALRSGRYKQTKFALRNSRGHCCLGVACEISGLGEFTCLRTFHEVADHIFKTLSEQATGVLPIDIADYYGLTVEGHFTNAVVVDHTTYPSLVAMNDAGIPFSTIADVIEANLDNFQRRKGYEG